MYFLNDFWMVPVAPVVTGITSVFTFHMSCISVARFLYFIIFSASFLITFLCHEFATSINIHVPLLFLFFCCCCGNVVFGDGVGGAAVIVPVL
jgi:hypothetical protein